MKYIFISLLLLSCGKHSGNNPTNPAPSPTQILNNEPLPEQPEVIDKPITSSVKLCPGIYQSSYPNYPEYALCISNNLYIELKGKLYRLSKGKYKPKRTGLSCTFKIEDKCNIEIED